MPLTFFDPVNFAFNEVNFSHLNSHISGMDGLIDMGLLPDTQNCGCACAGNVGNVFPATEGKRSWHASRHVRDARAVMHAGIANYRFPLKSAVGGKRSRHSRRMRIPQFYASGKRPMEWMGLGQVILPSNQASPFACQWTKLSDATQWWYMLQKVDSLAPDSPCNEQ